MPQSFAPPAQNFVIRPTCFSKFEIIFFLQHYLSIIIKNRKFDVFTVPSADTNFWPFDLVDNFLCAVVHDREIGAPAVASVVLLDQMRFAIIEKSFNADITLT